LSIDRDGFIEALHSSRRCCSVHFIPLHYSHITGGRMAISQAICRMPEKGISFVPVTALYPNMTELEIITSSAQFRYCY